MDLDKIKIIVIDFCKERDYDMSSESIGITCNELDKGIIVLPPHMPKVDVYELATILAREMHAINVIVGPGTSPFPIVEERIRELPFILENLHIPELIEILPDEIVIPEPKPIDERVVCNPYVKPLICAVSRAPPFLLSIFYFIFKH